MTGGMSSRDEEKIWRVIEWAGSQPISRRALGVVGAGAVALLLLAPI